MAIRFSHSHFVHVGFVSILVFQTFDRMIFGTLTFPGTRWCVMTVGDTQMVRDQKKFENHCPKRSTHKIAVALVLQPRKCQALVFLVRNKSDTLEQNWRELKL